MFRFQPHAQTTVESCLACCLLQLRHFHTNKPFSKRDEQELLFYAFKKDRHDWVANHLMFLSERYCLNSIRYVHNPLLFKVAKRVKGSKLILHKINLQTIDEFLQHGPAIIVIDSQVLWKFGHYPHWILIYKKRKNKYLTYEPWAGKRILLPASKLKLGVSLYLTRLWMAPQVITFDRPK